MGGCVMLYAPVGLAANTSGSNMLAPNQRVAAKPAPRDCLAEEGEHVENGNWAEAATAAECAFDELDAELRLHPAVGQALANRAIEYRLSAYSESLDVAQLQSLQTFLAKLKVLYGEGFSFRWYEDFAKVGLFCSGGSAACLDDAREVVLSAVGDDSHRHLLMALGLYARSVLEQVRTNQASVDSATLALHLDFLQRYLPGRDGVSAADAIVHSRVGKHIAAIRALKQAAETVVLHEDRERLDARAAEEEVVRVRARQARWTLATSWTAVGVSSYLGAFVFGYGYDSSSRVGFSRTFSASHFVGGLALAALGSTGASQSYRQIRRYRMSVKRARGRAAPWILTIAGLSAASLGVGLLATGATRWTRIEDGRENYDNNKGNRSRSVDLQSAGLSFLFLAPGLLLPGIVDLSWQ